jgi:hypothetical protein
MNNPASLQVGRVPRILFSTASTLIAGHGLSTLPDSLYRPLAMGFPDLSRAASHNLRLRPLDCVPILKVVLCIYTLDYLNNDLKMPDKQKPFQPDGLTIGYKQLGVISIDELAQALLADINALKDIYNVQFVASSRLKLFITNEYGDIRKLRRPGGGRIYYMDTHHYRPACKDYDL